MHDPFRARPVSGEIMTDAVATTGRPSVAGQCVSREIAEADFETVRADAPPSRFRNMPANTPKGVALLRSGGRQDHSQGRRGGLAFWAMGAILVTVAFLASGGYVLMGGSNPRPAAAYERSDGIHTARIPSSKIEAEAREGSEASHFLGTSADQAKAQGSFVFSDALEPPKDGEKSVSISYGEEE